jgi:two-component system invasion response regulator UvrY
MKILIADDHIVVREGLKNIVKRLYPDSLVEEAVDGIETLSKIEANDYDLVIMDISMPGKSGIDILTSLKDKKCRTNILILSIYSQEQYAIRVLKLGASGYLCKNCAFRELSTAINKILAGGKYISPVIAEKINFNKEGFYLAPHEKLSPREFQIMCLMAKGMSLKEISENLFISDKTVSTHRMHILEKMDLKKNAELTNYAIKNNLIE